MPDVNGKPWLKETDIKLGKKIILDDGFTCHPGGKSTIQADEFGWFFPCSHGNHYIDGQIDGESGDLIGVYPAPDGDETPDAEVEEGKEYPQEWMLA